MNIIYMGRLEARTGGWTAVTVYYLWNSELEVQPDSLVCQQSKQQSKEGDKQTPPSLPFLSSFFSQLNLIAAAMNKIEYHLTVPTLFHYLPNALNPKEKSPLSSSRALS